MKIMPTGLWVWPWRLRKNGVLGINERNLSYLFELNPRSLYRLADDKIVTKEICKKQDIPVPQTYAVIKRFGDLRNLERIIGERREFVIKPANGTGGRGVLVIVGRNGSLFEIAKGQMISLSDLRYHISTTLSGLYSLGEQSDSVIVERRIVPHPLFEKLAVAGTPDIRIILFRSSPVIAMLRLPTLASKGRANLHQGAAAAGIDLKTAQTLGGVYRNRAITLHPDTGAAIGGITIPAWDRMLETAKKLSEVMKMGYIGVDIVLDAHHGPVVLEVNARPGLSVQIANRSGLLPRLKIINAQPFPGNSHKPALQ
ncbi:MAG: alpha-L-glutamate ligase-like protein [Sedimentisphaerales bacterium]